jgi:tetratricopeptide (TPR) repeat protein
MKTAHYIVAFVLLLLLGVGLLSVPAVVRALPGRYASFLPEPLLALRRVDHPLTLPTAAVPVAAMESTVAPSETLPPSPTPLPTDTPSPSPTPTATATLEPSVTPEPTATPTETPSPTPTPPGRVLLTGIRHERQGWNNCGPTTLAMALSAWGRTETQAAIAPVLKPDPEDKHVAIGQMADYAEGLGLNAAVRTNGTLEGLKQFLRAGIPVIVRTWYVRDARDQLGHYRLAIGYDDATQSFDLYDSLYNPPTTMSYGELEELWRVFGWTYLVIAPPERWDTVSAILGPDVDDTAMFERTLARAEAELGGQPDRCLAYASCNDWDTFTWFTIGATLTSLGRHEEAAAAYDRSRALGLHYRMLWYQHGPYESYYAVGRYDEVIALANATLATAKNLEESYYWRARARLAQGDTAGAIADLRTALRYHRGWGPASALLAEIEE